MPTLQVRDLPGELYESLKISAVKNRRSLAQETTVAIESYLADNPGAGASPLHCDVAHTAVSARTRQRAEAFERIRNRGSITLPEGFVTAADLIRSMREDRDEQLLHGHGDAR